MTEQTRPKAEIQNGDYVLATRWSDGDPRDPWFIGFYDGNNGNDKLIRHYVTGNDGVRFRPGGYTRVKKISAEMGAWLLANQEAIEASGRSLYILIRNQVPGGKP